MPLLETSGCKTKSAGILHVFPAFLTRQMLFSVEFDKGLEFSECPYASCGALSGRTAAVFGCQRKKNLLSNDVFYHQNAVGKHTVDKNSAE